MKIHLNRILVKCKPAFAVSVIAIFCASCGVELQLYEWENMDLFLLNTNTRDTLEDATIIDIDNFAILVSLNPENTITVRSSDWVNASDGFQANDEITSIEITSNQDYNDENASGELLNDVFRAAFINEPTIIFTLENFPDEFGKQSNVIDEGFELIPFTSSEVPIIRDSLRTFTVRVALKNGGTFFQTTAPIRIQQ